MFVFGRNVAEEVLNSNKKIERIFIQDNFRDEEILKKMFFKIFSHLVGFFVSAKPSLQLTLKT